MPQEYERLKGWSASKKLIAGNRQKKLSFQKEFPNGAGAYTLQFNITSPVAPQTPNPTALINWKVQGNSIQRIVSLSDGVSISGIAEAVDVTIEDDSEAITGFNYTVAVCIAPGTRASNSVPPTYYPVQPTGSPGRYVVPAGLTREIDIPINSGITSVFVTASAFGAPAVLTEADIAVRQLADTAGAITLKQYDPRFAGWVPVSPSATILQLANFTLAGNIIFGVTFGVDG